MDKTKPYLDEDGTLVIPFECGDHSYKYWKQEGRSLADILAELGAGEDIWESYTHVPYSSGGPEAAPADAPAPDGPQAAPEPSSEPGSSEADLAQPSAMA